MENMKSALDQVVANLRVKSANKTKLHRFDIFKGLESSDGKIQKIRSVGAAQLMEGAKTYNVYLKTLLKDVFYLLPEQKRLTRGDYVILTRENSQTQGRRFYWNNIGECFLLTGQNAGLMKLSFDLFGADDIYMNLHPMNQDEEKPVEVKAAA